MNDELLSQLLLSLGDESPCGSNLEDELQFRQLLLDAEGSAEKESAGEVIAAEPPDWEKVSTDAVEILKRCKHLRLVTTLARAQLATNKLPGFASSLRLLHGMIEQFWEPLHPQLDPDDDNDPTERLNIISELAHISTLRSIDVVPLLENVKAGVPPITFRAIRIAKGELERGSDDPDILDETVISGLFGECDLEVLQSTSDDVTAILDSFRSVDTEIGKRIGSEGGTGSFDSLVNKFEQIQQALFEPLQKRGARIDNEKSDLESVEDVNQQTGGNGQTGGESLSGQIRSRNDAIRAMDLITRYYEQNEPSSPVPLLMNRAKRIASKSFLEIVKDLTPDALEKVQAIGGIDTNTNAESE